MTIADKLKLRLATWSVIGLATLHLIFGQYDYYPFIHWTMFADHKHKETKSTVSEKIVVAIDDQQQEYPIQPFEFFDALPDSNQTARTVADRYIKKLRAGDQKAVNAFVHLLQEQLGIQGITKLRVEVWVWEIDVHRFRTGDPLVGSGSPKPNRITEIITLLVTSN